MSSSPSSPSPSPHTVTPLRDRSLSSVSVGSTSSLRLTSTSANTRLRQSIQNLQRQAGNNGDVNEMNNIHNGRNCNNKSIYRSASSGNIRTESPLSFSLPSSRSSSPVPIQSSQDTLDMSRSQTPNSISDNFITLLSTVDFKQIDDMDPSLKDGSRVIFDGEVPIEVKVADRFNTPQQESGTMESMRSKILSREVDGELVNVRLELTTESDVFFHYTYTITRDDYPRLQQEQRFMVEYALLPQVLGKMLQACVEDPETFVCTFVMDQANEYGVLNFLQNLGYKFVELLSIRMDETPLHEVRCHIDFRYSSLRSRLAIMQSRLQDIGSVIKLKNPSLLLQLQKTPSNPQLIKTASTLSSLIKRNKHES